MPNWRGEGRVGLVRATIMFPCVETDFFCGLLNRYIDTPNIGRIFAGVPPVCASPSVLSSFRSRPFGRIIELATCTEVATRSSTKPQTGEKRLRLPSENILQLVDANGIRTSGKPLRYAGGQSIEPRAMPRCRTHLWGRDRNRRNIDSTSNVTNTPAKATATLTSS